VPRDAMRMPVNDQVIDIIESETFETSIYSFENVLAR
jgi:hypothetical protein